MPFQRVAKTSKGRARPNSGFDCCAEVFSKSYRIRLGELIINSMVGLIRNKSIIVSTVVALILGKAQDLARRRLHSRAEFFSDRETAFPGGVLLRQSFAVAAIFEY